MKWLTLKEIKDQLRIEPNFTDEDDRLTAYGESAEDTVLNTCQRTYDDFISEYGEIPQPIREVSLMLVTLVLGFGIYFLLYLLVGDFRREAPFPLALCILFAMALGAFSICQYMTAHSLRLIDTEKRKDSVLLRMKTQTGSVSDFRVDPHPAWSYDFRYIAFNGYASGTRRVYVCEANDLLKEP